MTMPNPEKTLTATYDSESQSEYFNSELMESFFDLTSAGEPKPQDDRSPRMNMVSNSPILDSQYRSSPITWNSSRNSPRYQTFNPSTSDLAQQTSIAPLQTTIAPDTFLGNPSPPDSSESSPNKYVQPGDASPLDSLILNMPENSRTTNGQFTPPDESPNLGPMRNPMQIPNQTTPEELIEPSSLSTSLTQHTPLSNEASSKTVNRKRSSPTAQLSRKRGKVVAEEETSEGQEAKRRRFLERNRVAASKCRQKKKAWMQDLETEARNAQSISKQLKLCVGIFKEEVLQLKTELLKHNTCDCAPIRQFLNREAMRLGESHSNETIHMHNGPRPSDASEYSFTLEDDVKLDPSTLSGSEFDLEFMSR